MDFSTQPGRISSYSTLVFRGSWEGVGSWGTRSLDLLSVAEDFLHPLRQLSFAKVPG